MGPIKIDSIEIGNRRPCFIIAELASAHGGSLKTAKKMVKAAVDAGADAVKFQRFACDELIVPRDPRYKNFKKIELCSEDWEELIKYSRRFKTIILADVYDEKSANAMEKLGVSAFKIPSSDVNNPYLIAHVAKKHRPIFIATGGSTLKEIENTINLIKSNGNREIILIYGFQSFPTKLEDTDLRRIKTLNETFGLNVGFHDHVDAESKMATILPLLALALGACVIEKHITLDRSIRGFDYHSSLNHREFKEMVEQIREVEKSFGTGEIKLAPAEEEYRKKMKKNTVARVNIPKGTPIIMDMLAFKRSPPGLPPEEAKNVVGKVALKNIVKNEVITLNDIGVES